MVKPGREYSSRNGKAIRLAASGSLDICCPPATSVCISELMYSMSDYLWAIVSCGSIREIY